MTHPETPATAKPVREDRRRAKHIVPYLALWACALMCVVFALIALLSRA